MAGKFIKLQIIWQIIALVIIFGHQTAEAQTSSFTFQGKLNDGGAPASGTYQFEFKLYDAAAGGNQIGQTISALQVSVSNGIFTVNLDFGADSFNGGERYIEVSVRQNSGSASYTVLNPRQAVKSTPYALKSLTAEQANTASSASNAIRLGNLPAAQYTQTTDARLSDARNPLPGSGNYIQNTLDPDAQQPGTANFNISGEGKANIFNAAVQFNINGSRVLSNAGNDNIFVGANAGADNTTGFSNSFVGAFAGQKNTTGVFNAFFGRNAGQNNTTGFRNSFYGVNAGLGNVSGSENAFFGLETGFNNALGSSNAFFGAYAGKTNTEGNFNAFFGRSAGEANTTGADNAFLGQGAGFRNTEGAQNTAAGSGAGLNNTTGSRNTFAGYLAGASNTTENDNTFLGYKANGAAGITNATAIGANAVVNQSNTMVLGTNAVTVQVPGTLSVAGTFSANSLNSATVYKINNNRVFHLTGNDNTAVGFESGNSITTGGFNAFFGSFAGKGTTTGINNAFFGSYAGRDNVSGTNNSFFGANAGISSNGSFNAFFGSGAGLSNTNGSNNSYFGNATGVTNSTGDNNSFFGSNAGKAVNNVSFNSFFGSFAGEKTATGAGNTFFGAFAGRENVIGFNNTFVGYKAGQTATTGNGNVAIGYNASVESGVSNAIAIGANVTASQSNATFIGGNSVYLNNLYTSDVNASDVRAFSLTSYGNLNVTSNGTFGGLVKAASFEATSYENVSKFQQIESVNLNVTNNLRADAITFGSGNIGGNTPLCMRTAGTGYYDIIPCSSSIRYKEKIENYTRGIELIEKLRPVTFNWKTDGARDVGFIAEEVYEIEPLLNNYNSAGQIEGVRYAQITTALVNAVKEQQEQIKQLQAQNEALKTLVCAAQPNAPLCVAAEKK